MIRSQPFVLFFAILVPLVASMRWVTQNEFTNVVSIKKVASFRYFDKHLCTGGLLTLEWFITDLNCVLPFKNNAKELRAYVGGRFAWHTRLLTGGAQMREVIFIRDITSKSSSIKFALVQVKEKFEETYSVLIPKFLWVKETNPSYLMPSWGRIRNVIIRFWAELFPGSYLASPFLRVLDFDQDKETPCPEDLGSPIFVNGAFAGIYQGEVTCVLGENPDAAKGILHLESIKGGIQKYIPEMIIN